MKLYTDLRKELEKFDKIQAAWFTSFNFSPKFVEKYLLSLLAKEEHQNINRPETYEGLNQALATVDVRFFYDYRAYNHQETKRTVIPYYDIDPARIEKGKFSHGVFHPKVGFVYGVDFEGNNKGLLIAGSANLSVNGWARNRETAFIQEIDAQENAFRVLAFFEKIQTDKEHLKKIHQIKRDWANQLENYSPSWKFISSFTHPKLLEHLKLEESNTLAVWSPYFGTNLSQIINTHILKIPSIKELKIIPHVSQEGKVGIDEGQKEGLFKNNHKVSFFKEEEWIESEEDALVHAKLWLTEKVMGIGSWNFSAAALGISGQNQNVEAGVLIDLNKNQFEKFITKSTLKDISKRITFTNQSEIDADKEDILREFTFRCSIVADWAKMQLFLFVEESYNSDEYKIILPGLKSKSRDKQIPLSKVDKRSFAPFEKEILKDRTFEVLNLDNEVVYIGVILELNTKERAPWGFDNLDDLMSSWLNSDPESHIHRQKLCYTTETDDSEIGEDIISYLNEDVELSKYKLPSWFVLFYAMKNINTNLKQAIANKNLEQLHRLIFVYPGSVNQVYKFVRNLDLQSMSTAYLWFLINETNTLIKKTNQAFLNFKLPHELFQYIELPKLKFNNSKDVSKNKDWLKYIKEASNYPKVRKKRSHEK